MTLISLNVQNVASTNCEGEDDVCECESLSGANREETFDSISFVISNFDIVALTVTIDLFFVYVRSVWSNARAVDRTAVIDLSIVDR